MKISNLLKENDSIKEKFSLSLNLGDAYLLKNNPLYLQIRKLTINAGFKFSTEASVNYTALPLTQLEDLLKSKIIPYTDNVSVLKKLESQFPNVIEWDDVADNLKKNFLFHESCHAVAREQTNKQLDTLTCLSEPNLFNEKIVRILIEESFANACELLAVSSAGTPAHKVFYEWNSYSTVYEQRTNFLNAKKEMGSEFIFKFIFLCYLHSNFLIESFSDQQLQRIIQFIGNGPAIDSKKLKTLKALAKSTLTLDYRFRFVTTGLHLRLNGSQKKYPEVLKFDFMKILETDKNFKSIILVLSQQSTVE